MKPKLLAKKISKLEGKLTAQHQKLAALKRKVPPVPVEDYPLRTAAGAVPLSSFFQGKRDLIVIHNMGRQCRYCTLWADGFNGIYPHLADRAGFVVVSPDAPAVQQKFAAGRGWRFPLASGAGSAFSKDMGFMPAPDEPRPGVSTFQRVRGKLFRVAQAPFGPFDPFCSLWHLFALLGGGIGEWEPQYRYPRAR